MLLIVLTLTAGTALLMWMGELITQRGIGNGMSLLIFASVVSRLPVRLLRQLKAEKRHRRSLIILVGCRIVILVAIVFVEQGQRRIPVQFAKRVVGRRMYGGQSTYIPLKVNQAGVIPIIFASSVLYLPVLLSQRPAGRRAGAPACRSSINDNLRAARRSSVYLARLRPADHRLRVLLQRRSRSTRSSRPTTIRKQGGFIPGIRPGPQTERYLAKILNRITLPGALFIAVIALLPVARARGRPTCTNFPFAGTTMLIAVGVALETMKQIDSQLMMRNYEGFLK